MLLPRAFRPRAKEDCCPGRPGPGRRKTVAPGDPAQGEDGPWECARGYRGTKRDDVTRRLTPPRPDAASADDLGEQLASALTPAPAAPDDAGTDRESSLALPEQPS